MPSPLPEVRLARRLTLALAVVLLIGLVLSRLSWARTEAVLTVRLFTLTGASLVAAAWSVFVRRRAPFAAAWLLGSLTLPVGGLLTLDGWTLSCLGEASSLLLFPASYGLLGALGRAVVRRRLTP